MSRTEHSVGRRLRRVRLQLMLIFLVAFIAGIGTLSALAIALDAGARRDALDASLRVSVSRGADLVAFDGTSTELSRFTDVYNSVPLTDLWAVERSTPTGLDSSSPVGDFTVIFPDFEIERQNSDIIDLGRDAVDAQGEVARTIDGRRYLALPFAADTSRGAVIGATQDPQSAQAHRSFVKRILLVDAVLIMCALLAAEVFGRRAMRASTLALEAQERFLANASHDLRNPIASIRAAAESARMHDVDVTTALQEVERSAVVATNVIESMLTLARLDSGALPVFEPVRLDLLVEQVLDGHEVASRITTELDAVVVRANAAMISRAITNLLNNAVEHSGAEAAVSVVVRENWVAVRDQGPGIDAEALSTIFDRFSASGSSRGYGLGLSIVQAVAEAHGGVTEARNHPDGGCEFRITLPRP